MVHGSSLWLWPWPWPGPWSWSWPCPWPAKGRSCQATALCWRAMATARRWSTWLQFLYAERKQKAYKFDRQKSKTLSSRNRSHKSWNIRASKDRRAEPQTVSTCPQGSFDLRQRLSVLEVGANFCQKIAKNIHLIEVAASLTFVHSKRLHCFV